MSDARRTGDRTGSVVTTSVAAAEAFLRTLGSAVAGISDGIFVADREGRILYANRAVEGQVGAAVEDLIGRHFLELFAGVDEETARQAHSRILEGEAQEAEIVLGSKVVCEFKAGPLFDEHGRVTGVFGITRDVSRRHWAEAANRQLLESSLQGLVILQNGRMVFVNPAFAQMTGYSVRELLAMEPETFQQSVHSEDRAMVWGRFRRRVAGEDAPARYRFRLHRKDGSLCWVELFASRIEYQGQPAIQAALVNITEQKQMDREQDAVVNMATALRTAQNRSEMLPVILEEVSDLLEADGAVFAICDPPESDAVLEVAIGVWSDATGYRLSSDEGITAHVLATGEPFLSNQVRADRRFARPDLLDVTHAVLGVPLIARDETVGVLWVGRARDFQPEDLRLLTAIGEMTANAIHRATLHERTLRQVHHLDSLRKIDRAITSRIDLKMVCSVILDQLSQGLAVDAARILRLDNPTRCLQLLARSGFRGPGAATERVPLDRGLAGRVAKGRQTVTVKDMRDRSDVGGPDISLAHENFVAYVGMPLLVENEVKGVLEVFHRDLLDAGGEWMGFLSTVAGQAAVAIENADLVAELQRSNAELAQAYDTTLEGWSRALELRDRETDGHAKRVSELAVRLARELGFPEEELIHVRRGSLLHDIGKMGVPDGILLKPAELSESEWKVMRHHPTYARDLLVSIDFLRPALDIPWCHHERWDGAGYPRRLKGEEIPLPARIFAVVDVWDALCSDRPYRPAWPRSEALSHIQQHAGSHFDPQVVQAFLKIVGSAH